MTNLPRNGLRALPDLPLIGMSPPKPPPVPLMTVIGNMADMLVQGRDLMAVVAQMRDGPDAGTDDAKHVIAVVEAFAVAQATVRGLHEVNQKRMRIKAAEDASGLTAEQAMCPDPRLADLPIVESDGDVSHRATIQTTLLPAPNGHAEEAS